MKNFRHFIPIVFGLLLMMSVRASNNTNIGCSPMCVEECSSDPIVLSPGKEYDFSYLKPGETAELAYEDDKGNPIRYRVTRTSGGLDVAVYTSSLQKADPNTVIAFKGPKGVVSSSTVGEIVSQRCGWLCVIAHVFCVKVHLGPPGNTWEWDCSGSTNEN
ncbi:hypothetical protein J1N09_08770 [Aureitalea sp. L0-47]|uniref:hypothetical protein n=1 Tax=Aureitalea sp. L0-47 TaxID=2816962 RepID=UPI00223796B1|nr:hypothetical protein [Aureitalea sp. L0-47]MCW5519927.1 hypothetical protein [Aureitalea sp. L0-47]